VLTAFVLLGHWFEMRGEDASYDGAFDFAIIHSCANASAAWTGSTRSCWR
jgi:hypothetical protein